MVFSSVALSVTAPLGAPREQRRGQKSRVQRSTAACETQSEYEASIDAANGGVAGEEASSWPMESDPLAGQRWDVRQRSAFETTSRHKMEESKTKLERCCFFTHRRIDRSASCSPSHLFRHHFPFMQLTTLRSTPPPQPPPIPLHPPPVAHSMSTRRASSRSPFPALPPTLR